MTMIVKQMIPEIKMQITSDTKQSTSVADKGAGFEMPLIGENSSTDFFFFDLPPELMEEMRPLPMLVNASDHTPLAQGCVF